MPRWRPSKPTSLTISAPTERTRPGLFEARDADSLYWIGSAVEGPCVCRYLFCRVGIVAVFALRQGKKPGLPNAKCMNAHWYGTDDEPVPGKTVRIQPLYNLDIFTVMPSWNRRGLNNNGWPKGQKKQK